MAASCADRVVVTVWLVLCVTLGFGAATGAAGVAPSAFVIATATGAGG